MRANDNVLILFAHPLLEKSKINKFFVRKYQQRSTLKFHDLYEEYPEFNINIPYEKALLEESSLIIWHHPLYWYSSPPLLKQWIDMVLEVGWAYGPNGNALKGKHILQVITTGGSEQAYQVDGNNRFTIREFLRPFEQTAYLCNMNYLPPFVIHGTHRISQANLDQNIEQFFTFLDNWQESIDSLLASSHNYLHEYLQHKNNR
ncbi:MAG: NAD(P)H-dependent oxidoreductase [Raineya sp.]|jgi:glutathione-regulated potassium-efflux system ancillary protein KefG|nr:NAD(P)H-dependent oxidoreductase [Raineya sp.]